MRQEQDGPSAPGTRRMWPRLLGLAAAVGITGGVAVVVLIALVALVILAVVAVVVLAVFVLVLVVAGPVSSGPEFVDALAADNDRAAYGLLCERTVAEIGFDEFVARFAPAKPVVDSSIVTSGASTFGPPKRVDATFVFDDGTTTTVTYLAQEGPDGNFYVCDPPPLQ